MGEEGRPLDAVRRADIRDSNQQLAGEALRTLGVAYRSLPPGAAESGEGDESLEQELVFAGLVGMIDPPRAEAKEAVALARAAGIRPIMITGDHPMTAAVIAAELGVSDDRRVCTGAELEKMTDDALRGTVQETSVFARVSPNHKLRLVQALQQAGAIVAMTGDGVNDVPPLDRVASYREWVDPTLGSWPQSAVAKSRTQGPLPRIPGFVCFKGSVLLHALSVVCRRALRTRGNRDSVLDLRNARVHSRSHALVHTGARAAIRSPSPKPILKGE